MFLLNLSLCRAPGSDPAASVGLWLNFPAQSHYLLFLGGVVLISVLPMLFYWQYRRRRWWFLGVELAIFLLWLDYFMLVDRGSIGQTFFSATLLFGSPCVVLALCVEWSRYLGQAIFGNTMASLRVSEWLIFAGLAVSAHLSFFLAVNVFDILSPRVLNAVSDVINCLFSLPRRIDLRADRDVLNMLLAAWPTLMLMIVLHAWLRYRRAHDLALPWLLYAAATPGALGSALLLWTLIMP
ncbi:MAG: hypothetical protein WAN92_02260 [Herbaspirillum sp.]